MPFQKISYDSDDAGVATITLDDPDTRNALGEQLLQELTQALEQARDDDAVRCVVLRSSHERVFSAGGDLAQFAADVPAADKHVANGRFPRLFELIADLHKPTICQAGGHVLAGSLGLALACDLIVASDQATFGTPEIGVGVFPFMVMALLYRNIPRKRANELLLLGARVSAQDAREIGLVNRVVKPKELDGAVAEWASMLASKSPLLMRMGKDAMYCQMDMPFREALQYLRHNLTLSQGTDDLAEGVAAFFEKREPEWSGR